MTERAAPGALTSYQLVEDGYRMPLQRGAFPCSKRFDREF
jgi:hypothetical protein